MSEEKPLSDRQQSILKYIYTYTNKNARPPTIREIGAATKISSTSVVNYNLTRLEERGFLDRASDVSRGLRLTDRAVQECQRFVEVTSEMISGMLRIPKLGKIVAGEPIPVMEGGYDLDDAIEISSSMVSGRVDDLFALEVSGESMIDAMINDGDIVIMRQATEARDGDMVAALIDGDETTLKYFYNEGRRIRLQPANPTMEPIYVEPKQVQVQGKVMMVLRQTA